MSAYVSALLVLCCLVAAVSIAGLGADESTTESRSQSTKGSTSEAPENVTQETPAPTPAVTTKVANETASMSTLPGGGTKVFGRKRFLVAYYGTAGTDALGVLGERPPDQMHRRLRRAARDFKRRGEQILPVYELIVTVADATPGKDGDYNHDISRRAVRSYIKAAERNGALVVLDIQPGRDDFLTVAKRWEWALEHPLVGLALDPEWRMGPRQVPGRVIGSVRAREVNQVSAWLDRLTRRQDLPEKVFMLHSFRSSMIVRPDRLVDRPELAEVLHIDGFGTPSQKLDTYRALARPRQFRMGFKLFYDEDVPMMRPRAVRKIRPKVRFVSFQ
ncbi:hypothetical protein [Nocardioides gilvus]|uniref:hypothetical protein n=1 Tax=Nocardioides gilvus TaxID=1735589 RepID=UPI000D74173B|nr:hypothetical protein [Nocardioides gilvus]